MATILLSAAGAALGAGFGGTVLGLSGAVIGRAIGATIGQRIDQRLLAGGSEPVEVGRVDRFQLTGAGDGEPVQRLWGRMRVGGQVIWATRFQEHTTRQKGGKGMPPRPVTTTFSYSVSLAVALCEGLATRVGRVWADGGEIAAGSLDLRFYPGSEDQLPDPKIAAVEGADNAPAYRGIAYVVIEDLDLSRFGNRVPQFTFEVMRRAQGAAAEALADLPAAVRAVALIPGTGEYALATTPVHFSDGPGLSRSANVHTAEGTTDFAMSLTALDQELPNAGSVSLVVSWFGSDLRCASCRIKPKVEQAARDGVGMPWVVSDLNRAAAEVLPMLEGRPVYGGTPADRAVIEAIAAIRASGKAVMLYPFILMEQLAGNGLPDPWSEAADQPVLPWRGRITTSKAPGRAGTPDRTVSAEAEVAAFLGAAALADFSVAGGAVHYSGPADWGFRRFILHYAHLCALAGGVDAFCIGSELRSLTQVRGDADGFPMVAALAQLAGEVRAILPGTQISYAADWSEYFGYHADGNVYFHLDPLWSDANIDFVGIDNYMPLSDWRDGPDHADADWGSIYSIDYLKANIAGGEGFDWFYDSPEGVAAQLRKPIADSEYGEDWVYRYKDLAGWWGHDHHDRIGGIRSALASGWVPGMKPIRFTEFGCAALDKGSNEPNKFLDPKSSESALPRASDGRRDDFIQMQYLRAMQEYWSDGANNPISTVYAAPMLDLARCHVWAWDARPFPEFPGNAGLWGDGANYTRGHWLNGRSSGVPLAGVTAEICGVAGLVADVDVSTSHGVVRGYAIDNIGSARAALQPLSLAYAMEAREREGILQFYMRSGVAGATLDPAQLAMVPEISGALETSRSAVAETTGRVRLSFFEAESDFEIRSAEAVFPDETSPVLSQSEVPLQLTADEARAITERWLAEARVARDTARFALPRSQLAIGAGDVVTLEGLSYRLDRMETGEAQLVEAVRIGSGAYLPGTEIGETARRLSPPAPLPVFPVFLDLPLLTGDEAPQAPHIAVAANPWPGSVAVWSAPGDSNYDLNKLLDAPAIFGLTENTLPAADPGLWDDGPGLRVRLSTGELASVAESDVLNGANVAAIGDGTPENWEIFQFASASLVAPGTYDLMRRLRGQAGTDGVMPAAWPAGSQFVVLDTAAPQIELAASARGLERFYRVGAADRGYSDANVTLRQLAFNGIGYRPYSVAHLALAGSLGGDLTASWLRRTRIDGDSWESADVPLGEDSERYLVRVLSGLAVKREVEVTGPAWIYTAAQQAADGAAPGFTLAVAQLSTRFGPGPFKTLTL